MLWRWWPFNRIMTARMSRVEYLLKCIDRRVGIIMATQAELAQELVGLKGKLEKIGTETSGLIQKVDDLTQALANQQLTPEVQSALEAVKVAAQAVDDLVPDLGPDPEPAGE
jgi:uncharacterized protein YoxC